MMLNKAMFDWLTLTTFEARNADDMRYLEMDAACEDAKRLQYVGQQWGGVFVGQATQAGKPHYMAQISGEVADSVADIYERHWTPYDWNVTRCDLQVTIPLPPRFNSRELYDDIERWEGPGRSRQVSIVQSGDGLDTVYIGSRTSDRFTRIYVKPIDGGLKALRFEVEYKGEHAHRVLHDCIKDPDNKRYTLVYELMSLPDLRNGLKDAFRRVISTSPHKPAIKRVTGQNSTLDWLRETVEPSLERLANDHDVGPAIELLVREWYNRYCH